MFEEFSCLGGKSHDIMAEIEWDGGIYGFILDPTPQPATMILTYAKFFPNNILQLFHDQLWVMFQNCLCHWYQTEASPWHPIIIAAVTTNYRYETLYWLPS